MLFIKLFCSCSFLLCSHGGRRASEAHAHVQCTVYRYQNKTGYLFLKRPSSEICLIFRVDCHCHCPEREAARKRQLALVCLSLSCVLVPPHFFPAMYRLFILPWPSFPFPFHSPSCFFILHCPFFIEQIDKIVVDRKFWINENRDKDGRGG